MLANHVYWNLEASINTASQSVLSDTLYMSYISRYDQIDGIEVPDGTVGITRGGLLGFTSPTKVGTNINDTVNNYGTGYTGYDNAFILDPSRYSSTEDPDIIVLTMSSPETSTNSMSR